MTNMTNPYAAPAPDLRASDADRDEIARRLGDALADGRLTQDEHGERLEAAYSAKTVGDLAPLIDDLPGGGHAPAAPAHVPAGAVDHELLSSGVGSENIAAVFGAAERKGRWLVEPRTNVSTIFGGVELDMREAVFSQAEVVVQCAVVLGGLEITVPPGVRVVNDTSAVLGGVDDKEHRSAAGAGAPTVRLTGLCLLGGITVRTRDVGAEK